MAQHILHLLGSRALFPRPLSMIPQRVEPSQQALFARFALEKAIEKPHKDVLGHVAFEIELVPVELVGNAVKIVSHGLRC